MRNFRAVRDIRHGNVAGLGWGPPRGVGGSAVAGCNQQERGSNSYYLASTGDFQLNLVLLHGLEDQIKLKLHP
jgi:hypothetical protein